MKKIFERFMNYLHGAEVSKTFSEWLVENVSAFMKNVKALFSLTKLFEQVVEIQQRLTAIETQNDANKSEILKAVKTLSYNGKRFQEEITAGLFEQAGEIQQRLTDIEIQNSANKSEILKAVKTLSYNGKKSQEEINAEIQKLGKNIADELSILDESTRMLLVASVLDNLERAGK